MRSFIVGVRAMLIALVVVILTPAAFAQSAAGVDHASPAANIGGPSENLTDTTGDGGNTEHCGPIDPGTPCYSSGGTTTCPANTSYAKCKERCECQYKKNLKACRASGPCVDLVTSERNACLTSCDTDWS